MNRRLKASMFYCYPTSSGLLTLLKIVAKMIHISSFILLLLLCTNKSILGNLMKQYVLGGSFGDLECICLWYLRFLCKTNGHDQNKVLTDRSVFVTYVLKSHNVYISSDLGDAFSDYVGGFLDVPGNSWDNENYCRTPGTLTLFWRLSVYPRSRLQWSRKILGREGFAYSTN